MICSLVFLDWVDDVAVLGSLSSTRRRGVLRACQRVVLAAWIGYADAHVFTLDCGTTVWIDEFQTVFIDTAPFDNTGCACGHATSA